MALHKLTLHEKLKNRLAIFDDSKDLIEASRAITHKLKANDSCGTEQLYVLEELISNVSGLEDLAASAIRAVKALERPSK